MKTRSKYDIGALLFAALLIVCLVGNLVWVATRFLRFIPRFEWVGSDTVVWVAMALALGWFLQDLARPKKPKYS